MPMPRYRLRTLLIVVAVVALDCAVVPVAESLAGGLLVGLALQVGLFRLVSSRGRARRFWGGFEATGLVMLILYMVGQLVRWPVMVRWPRAVLHGLNGAASHLPPAALQWYLEHLFINPNTPLRVIDVIVVFEGSYGVPMLAIAAACGLVAALVGPRRGCRAGAGTFAREPAAGEPSERRPGSGTRPGVEGPG